MPTKRKSPCANMGKHQKQKNSGLFIPDTDACVKALEEILGRYYRDRTRQKVALLDAQEHLDSLCENGSFLQFLNGVERLDSVKKRLARTEDILQQAELLYQALAGF